MKASYLLIILFGIISGLALSACNSKDSQPEAVNNNVGAMAEASSAITLNFTLKTIAADGKLAYIGIGGEIDGVVNPDLIVQPDSVVKIILVNGDGMPHDLFLPDFDVKTDYVTKIGDQTEIVFEAGGAQPGVYVYYCTVPGHRQAGQEGKLIVSQPPA